MATPKCAEDGVRDWLNQVLAKSVRYSRNSIHVVAHHASTVLASHNVACAKNPTNGQPSVTLLIKGIGRLHAVATACSQIPSVAYYLKQEGYNRQLQQALDEIRGSGQLCGINQMFVPDGLKAAEKLDQRDFQEVLRHSGSDQIMLADLLLAQPPISDALELKSAVATFKRLNASKFFGCGFEAQFLKRADQALRQMMASPAYIGNNAFGATSILHPPTTPSAIPAASKYKPAPAPDPFVPSGIRNRGKTADGKKYSLTLCIFNANPKTSHGVDVTASSKSKDLSIDLSNQANGQNFKVAMSNISGQQCSMRTFNAGAQGVPVTHYLLFLWFSSSQANGGNQQSDICFMTQSQSDRDELDAFISLHR